MEEFEGDHNSMMELNTNHYLNGLKQVSIEINSVSMGFMKEC